MEMNKRMRKYHHIEEAIVALQRGKIIIVTDDENRENEGDLICAAEFATTENVNFMATYGKGLICMPMSRKLTQKLGLLPMVSENGDNHGTAFTVSIDHMETTTGISAVERSFTAMQSVREDVKPEEFRKPGHMFPLTAKEKGVLERPGHTEATVDLMRLAGLKECGLCCEIMREDGTMMHRDELWELAEEYDLNFITIQDLIKYRKQHEILVHLEAVVTMPTKFGLFQAYGYVDSITGEHHVALVKGDVTGEEPVLCRVHSECLTGDVFGSLRCDCGEQFEAAMKQIEKEGRGVLLYMHQEGRGIGLINKLKAYELQEEGMDTVEANLSLGFKEDLRDYSIATQILRELGVKKVHLLTNNPDKIEQLREYGIQIEDRIAIEMKASPYNLSYLKTKQEKMKHYLHY